ncbi:MAG: hypothetical protein Q8P48_03290 [Deltaproteobacteria bacterium]|nr:hypothetical protein [Deltaproteobacteria bacterium]
MKKVLLSVMVFLAAVVAAAPAAHAVVNLDARYWFTSLDSTVMLSSGSTAGTEFDFVDDLGLDENKGFLEGRITLELGSHKLRYGFVPLKWDGSKTLDRNITFGGQTFTATTQVDSELTVNYHRLGYEYDIIDTLENRLGVIFELKYLDGEASLDAAGASETESFRLPIPTVGVAAQVGLPFLFSVGGEVTGVTLGANAYLVDGEAAINLKPAPFVVISGGYRILKVHAEKDLDRGDITVQGPFVNLRADF